MEVNVEDPAPSFQFVRDLTDLYNCRIHNLFQSKVSLQEWDQSYADNARKLLRITPTQIRRCYEIFKSASVDMNNENQYTDYRLEVKARLNVLYAEDLSVASHDIAERKRRLHNLYKQLERNYLDLYARHAAQFP